MAAAASIQRAEEAKTAREEKNAEWEQMKNEHDALMAEQKAAKEAGDDAKALKIEQNMKKTEAKREAVRVDNEKAKEHFKMVQAETETKKMAQKQAMASRQADLQARRDAATRQVEAARAARKEKETERLAKHHQQQEEMLRFRNGKGFLDFLDLWKKKKNRIYKIVYAFLLISFYTLYPTYRSCLKN